MYMLIKNNMPAEIIASGALAKHGVVAFFGALVHALNAHRHGDTKSFVDIVTLTVISSFSGVMFALIALHFFQDGSYLTLAFAGSGGFLGVEGMSLVIKVVKKSISANMSSGI
jgi:hypothetical protein